MTNNWITDRPPTRDDADRDGDVIACSSPTLDKTLWMYQKWHHVTPGWPWRHTNNWTPPTPAPEPAPAVPVFKVGQVWRTRGGYTCRVKDIGAFPEFPILTDLYYIHLNDLHGKSMLGDGTDYEDDLVELIENPPQPEPTPAAPEPEAVAPEPKNWITEWLPTEVDGDSRGEVNVKLCIKNEVFSSTLITHYSNVEAGTPWRHTDTWVSELQPKPTPAAPEPNPEKATRGFLSFTRVEYEDGFIDSAVGTDGTAWIKYRAGLSDEKWLQVDPLPQPGEE